MVSIEDQIREIEREIGLRHQVYARQVASGKISVLTAAQRIDAMKAVLETLEEVQAMQEAVRYVGKARETE